jgi:dimeric dUTPase (all-alpha-NTP-PPase superfamily)
MNFEKLFETQRKLREKINYNEPDRFEKLILSLLVEIGECANEWRGFKFWSQNQEPNTEERVSFLGFENGEIIDTYEYKNPLLEEYVDGLHFVLELGIELEEVIGDYTKSSYRVIEQQISWQKAENVTRQFTKVCEHAANLQDDDYYSELFAAYIILGEMLGFTPEEIEAAYFEKNQVNHERQENGY